MFLSQIELFNSILFFSLLMKSLPNLSKTALTKHLLHLIITDLKLKNLAIGQQDHLVIIMSMVVETFLAEIKIHTGFAFEAVAL
jgi:hypothetical protein